MNHHGSKAWVKASELQDIALSVVLSVALLEIVLSKHPGEVNSDSSHSRTSVTKDFEEGGRNKEIRLRLGNLTPKAVEMVLAKGS